MLKVVVPLAGVFLLLSCHGQTKTEPIVYEWIGEEVTISAYNSVAWQTDGNPNRLIKQGLQHNTMVRIATFPDTFLVKDKMNRRWRKRMDVYMGADVKKARQWGRKKMMICYAVPLGDSLTESTK